jgi:hypothetical protein
VNQHLLRLHTARKILVVIGYQVERSTLLERCSESGSANDRTTGNLFQGRVKVECIAVLTEEWIAGGVCAALTVAHYVDEPLLRTSVYDSPAVINPGA